MSSINSIESACSRNTTQGVQDGVPAIPSNTVNGVYSVVPISDNCIIEKNIVSIYKLQNDKYFVCDGQFQDELDWIIKYPIIKNKPIIKQLYVPDICYIKSVVLNETLLMMEYYGIDNVRGGPFLDIDLDKQIVRIYAHSFDRCLNCLNHNCPKGECTFPMSVFLHNSNNSMTSCLDDICDIENLLPFIENGYNVDRSFEFYYNPFIIYEKPQKYRNFDRERFKLYMDALKLLVNEKNVVLQNHFLKIDIENSHKIFIDIIHKYNIDNDTYGIGIDINEFVTAVAIVKDKKSNIDNSIDDICIESLKEYISKYRVYNTDKNTEIFIDNFDNYYNVLDGFVNAFKLLKNNKHIISINNNISLTYHQKEYIYDFAIKMTQFHKDRNICIDIDLDKLKIALTIVNTQRQFIDNTLPSLGYSYVYRLLLLNDDAYVGKSDNPDQRFLQHSGMTEYKGAYWPRNRTINRDTSPIICDKRYVLIDELFQYIKLVKEKGKHKVRGGPFFITEYDIDQINIINKLISYCYQISINYVEKNQYELAKQSLKTNMIQHKLMNETFKTFDDEDIYRTINHPLKNIYNNSINETICNHFLKYNSDIDRDYKIYKNVANKNKTIPELEVYINQLIISIRNCCNNTIITYYKNIKNNNYDYDYENDTYPIEYEEEDESEFRQIKYELMKINKYSIIGLYKI